MSKELDDFLFKHPPRVQGKVGEAEPGQGHDGKWFFEMWVSFIGSDIPKHSFGTFGPFETEKLALVELKQACKRVCDQIQLNACGETSGKYYDMQQSELRDWDEN